MSVQRLSFRKWDTLVAFFVLLLFFLLAPTPALAQAEGEQPDTTQNKILLPLIAGSGPATAAVEELAPDDISVAGAKTPLNLIVDTDMGVNDATALIWLLSQSPKRVNVVGIVTVAGNTNVISATDNALTVLDWMGKTGEIDVIKGSPQPYVQALSPTSAFLHGADGLWGLGVPHDQSSLVTDEESFYCTAISQNSHLTVLALGPLTNIAKAYTWSPQCAAAWSSVEIVALGGAKYGGNATPVAEYNFWQDPEAASIVVTRALTVTIVPLDAFSMPTIDLKDVDKLAAKGNEAAKKLAPALYRYADIQIYNTGRANIPDAVAAVYALDRKAGTAQRALIAMVLQASLARGQSVVALTYAEHVQLSVTDAMLGGLAGLIPPPPPLPLDIKDFLDLLKSYLQYVLVPDNAHFVTEVQKDLLTKTVLHDLSK